MINFRKNALPALLFALFLAIAMHFSDLLTIENIKDNKGLISEFIKGNYLCSVFIFFLSCVIFINSPLPLAAVIKVLGGFFFGFKMGAIYNIVATILACMVGFGISRYALKDIFETIYYERLKSVENDVEKNGFYYFLTLRLVMIAPYFLINILAGISRVSFNKYLFSTTLGVMPASFIYANGGDKLEQINSISQLFESDIVMSLVLVAAISLVPIVLRK